MDWYPLFNSVRIAVISTGVVLLSGVPAAYYIARLPWLVRRALDMILTLPLLLPPTVAGWLLFMLLGPQSPIGMLVQAISGGQLVMHWWSAVFATALVSFPWMYRAARQAFAWFDPDLADAARTLGCSNIWVFWRIQMPLCCPGILAGAILSFARALGEYGAVSMVAGYAPGRTATISTTVYQLWQAHDNISVLWWVLIDVALSLAFLLALRLLEQRRTGIH